jgi:DNA replication protein DnaC
MAELPTIGKRKYEALKALDLENLTDETLTAFNMQFKNITVAEGIKMVKAFEEKNPGFTKPMPSTLEYFKKINEPEPEKEIQTMTKEWLWKAFSKIYFQNEKTAYSKDFDSIENIKPLIYYFLGDEENFRQCQNVSLISKPSLKKGLLIIGGYGNGKTSVMNAFQKALVRTNIKFKGYTSNEVVLMYESCATAQAKEDFFKQMNSHTVYFDDVLTEREASNYGKSDLFKEILEERYHKRKRTYITCNYKDGTGNDLKQGLQQFGSRYGSRVYDRIFDMFNVIEFKGKSFRK